VKQLSIAAQPPYDVLLAAGLLDQAGFYAASAVRGRRVLIVADQTVAALYLPRVLNSFEAAGFRAECFTFAAGESHKTLETLGRALEAAAAAGLTRSDCFAALGGGVTGDLTGLAAALYMRGVDFVQLPTTLLAMVDAAVGGKTAVNLQAGKNLCGAFWQPRLVLCDPQALNTLPPAVFAEGMAEAIKDGAVCDAALLDGIARGEELTELIAACIRIKGEIVRRDARDQGERQLLNFGHTFGHALEKLNDYAVYHGAAVSVGMLIASYAAACRGLCGIEVYDELRTLLSAHKLPVSTPFAAAAVAASAAHDKKRQGDTITLVLPSARGRCVLHPLPAEELANFIACCDGVVTGV